MSWPSITSDVTEMDQGTDNAGNARAAIKQAVDNVNEMIAARGVAEGVAPLDAGGLLPVANLPTVTAAKGGTGQTAFAIGDILYANSATTLAKLSPGTSGKSLVTKGSGNPPAWEVSGGLPSGTRMVFNQTAAPLGWTKDTTAALDDSLLRIVTGTVSSGGSNDFADIVNVQTSTASHTLTTSQIPSHSHGTNILKAGTVNYQIQTGKSKNVSLGNTSSQGGGGSHSHGITMDIKYNDFIIAERD